MVSRSDREAYRKDSARKWSQWQSHSGHKCQTHNARLADACDRNVRCVHDIRNSSRQVSSGAMADSRIGYLAEICWASRFIGLGTMEARCTGAGRA